MEVGVAHVTTVDEEIVAVATAAHGIDSADETFNFYERRIRFDRQESAVETFAKHVHNAPSQGGGRQIHHFGVAMHEAEGDLGVSEDDMLELGEDVAELGFV